MKYAGNMKVIKVRWDRALVRGKVRVFKVSD